MNFKLLEQYLDSLGEEYGLPGLDILVTKDHETVYRHMTGFADANGKRPVSDRDFYYFYSCSKVITMTAMLQLIEEGKVSLYDPVCRFLPEWEYMTVINDDWKTRGLFFSPGIAEPAHFAKHQVRIIDLMSMTAGLTYDLESEAIRKVKAKDPNANTREVIAALAEIPLLFEPGTHYQYSLAHDVIAAVIEVISGETFEDYLQNHLFKPLGITDLTCRPTAEQLSRLSAMYDCLPDTKKIVLRENPVNIYALTPNYDSGGAGLGGTVNGYSPILEALANGGVGRTGARILKEETVKLFSRSVITGEALQEFRVWRFLEYSYGLGVRVKTDPTLGLSPVGEFGWDGAAGAYAMVDPVNHVSIFFAIHVHNFMDSYMVVHPRVRDLVYKGLAKKGL